MNEHCWHGMMELPNGEWLYACCTQHQAHSGTRPCGLVLAYPGGSVEEVTHGVLNSQAMAMTATCKQLVAAVHGHKL